MLHVSAIIHTKRQAEAWAEFQKAYLGDVEERKEAALAELTKNPPVFGAPLPIPEPTASSALPATHAQKPALTEQEGAEPVTDPFAALQAGAESATPAEPEKPKRGRRPKAESAEPEKSAGEKPFDLDAIRKASTIALDLVGAAVIQEALAKFNAVDEKNVLRMSALRSQDYELYVGYLKKKVNDAAKEWPVS